MISARLLIRIFWFDFSVVENARIVDLELRDLASHPDGIQIIQFVTLAINKEIRD